MRGKVGMKQEVGEGGEMRLELGGRDEAVSGEAGKRRERGGKKWGRVDEAGSGGER